MFIETLKQFLYGWLFKWIENQLNHAKEKHLTKLEKKNVKTKQTKSIR
jgi:hypothetical protein